MSTRSMCLRRGGIAGIACAAIASLACAGVARTVVTDRELLDQLGLLRPGTVTRDAIEARLGPPEQQYEGGSIGAYSLMEVDGLLIGRRVARSDGRFWLVVQYDADGMLVRRSLIRAPWR